MAVTYLYLVVIILITTLNLAVTQIMPTAEPPMLHVDCPLLDDANHAVHLPNPNYCNKYYSCFHGMAYPMACPDNLHWSILTYRCDYPEVANCVSFTSTPSMNTASTIPSFTNGSPAKITHIPSVIDLPTAEATHYQTYPNDCSHFYQCETMRCPSNLHWNTHLQRCDYPHLAECTQPPVAIDIPIPANLAPPNQYKIPADTYNIPTAATPPFTITILPAGNSTNPTAAMPYDLDALCSKLRQKYIAHPSDCHKFIQCNGIAFVHTCPANLFWNSQLLSCDHYCM